MQGKSVKMAVINRAARVMAPCKRTIMRLLASNGVIHSFCGAFLLGPVRLLLDDEKLVESGKKRALQFTGE